MNDEQHALDWTQVLDEIDTDSPYTYMIGDQGVELSIAGDDEALGGVVGTLHSPTDWERIKLDVERLGIWPARMSF